MKKELSQELKHEYNQELLDAFTGSTIDYSAALRLLAAGADPCGTIMGDGKSTVLSELFIRCNEDEHIAHNLPQIIQFLIDYGMDPGKIKPSDDSDENCEMWNLAFCSCRESIEALKVLLDNQLNIAALEDCICHGLFDLSLLDEKLYRENKRSCGDIESDAALYRLILAASYKEVYDSSAYIKEFINSGETVGGSNNLSTFRDYSKYIFEPDFSTCEQPNRSISGAIFHILEKETGKKCGVIAL